MDERKKYWFAAIAPEFGSIGWVPCTWQGWAVLVVFLVLLVAGGSVLQRFSYGYALPLWVGGLGGALLAVFFLKGEPLNRWNGRR